MGNLQSAIDELATEDLRLAGPVAVAESLVEEFRQVERLQADALRRLAFVDASGAWAHEGSLSTQAWLRRHCRMAPGAAAERVRVARRLEELPEARDAFRSGDIGYAHVRLIAEAVNTSERCRDKGAEAEPILVEAARELDPSRLRRAVEHWRHIVDAAGFAESEAERYDRRRLHLSPIMDGMEAIDGLLDAEGSATLKTALDPLAAPLPGDTRTPAQRRADAGRDGAPYPRPRRPAHQWRRTAAPQRQRRAHHPRGACRRPGRRAGLVGAADLGGSRPAAGL
jgi:hypothetical protein